MAKAAAGPARAPKKPNDQEILARSYRKPFLDKVIIRADFAAPIVIEPAKFPKKLRALILKSFPILEVQKKVEKEIVADAESVKTSTQVFPFYVFSDKKRKNQVVLAHDNLALTYEIYQGYTNLKKQFFQTLDALLEEYPETQFKRLGLRYVDKIQFDEPNPTDWSDYLDKRLLCNFSIATEVKTISRAFQILDFNYGDYKMRFQYGMLNPDFPSPIKQKIFTLDYDSYIEELIERSELERTLDRFHTKLKLSFEEIITDKLRKKMIPV